ncbi:hypothetical protein Ct61P_06197 [Colletotrichum tofieldiae]|nr:hypothetical protein Ct61P_06197 [Colletotrichum tofieldiae]
MEKTNLISLLTRDVRHLRRRLINEPQPRRPDLPPHLAPIAAQFPREHLGLEAFDNIVVHSRLLEVNEAAAQDAEVLGGAGVVCVAEAVGDEPRDDVAHLARGVADRVDLLRDGEGALELGDGVFRRDFGAFGLRAEEGVDVEAR